ncbi:amidohydrolase [Anoxybacter fermentans]|uniref:Amidohydrolase n=1 Tax=Anoxybacter fermentans TaxID=1323375 RepID=A0A3S9T2N6_9FIRM|nr:amidohydrolase [Anoxybacter fermentans]
MVDGTGNPWFRGDIGIKDGRIVKISKISPDAEAKQVIDARGMVVSPGFIDIHSHSDLPLLVDGLAQGKVRQGVTTEVIGNCGFTLAPLMSKMAKEDLKNELEEFGLELNWETMDEYLNLLQKQGVSLNVVPLIGHGIIRKSVMNYDKRKASNEEIKKMRQLVRECMEAGAFGITTGLIYPPSCYADLDELVDLAKVVAHYGGFYATHMRNESAELYQAVEESIDIGRRVGLPVQISHHKVCQPDHWGEVDRTLKLMHRVRNDEGLDVTCDVYPYIATATGLSAVIPEEYHEGGKEKLLAHLKDPATRKILLSILETQQGPRGWHNLFISSVKTEKNRTAEGKDVQTLAKERGISPADVVIDLLIEEELAVGMIRFAMCEDDVVRVLTDDLAMVGSDGGALAIDGPLAKGKPHPRNFGTFPRVLGKYVREEGVLTLEKAVQKMTSMPAARLGLMQKGILREGLDADITIFDPATVKDMADFKNPLQYPVGIFHVIVNGTIVVQNGEHTGKKPGKVLRKS